MRDKYDYIDPDYLYTDPKTGVLRNLGGLSSYDDLMFFENAAFLKRSNELKEHPIAITGIASLLDMHRYLFQDVYEWAGKKRTVEISKQGKQFFKTYLFDRGFKFIDSLIADYRKIPLSDKEGIAYFLAIILDSINYLHPFREGNGRAQREFIRMLALEKGFAIDLNPPNETAVYEKYMTGTIDGDIVKLTELFLDLMK
jgi:cell filamentation protein